MITKQTAYDIWIAYDEITKGEKLLADLEKAQANHEQPNLRDAFGRIRGLQLGVPNGDNSHRLFDVHPSLAIEVIKAHVAGKKAELGALMCRANTELSEVEYLPPHSGVLCRQTVCPECHVALGIYHRSGCKNAL